MDEVQKDGHCPFRSVVRQFVKRAKNDELVANHEKVMQVPPDEDGATFCHGATSCLRMKSQRNVVK